MVLLPVSRSRDVVRSSRKKPTQPSSGDVETVSASVARDPGLRVPTGAFNTFIGDAATAFAPEVERMAKIAFKKDQEAADMRDKEDLNNAKIESTRRMLELKQSFKDDTNHRTQGDRAQMGYANIRNEVGGNLPEHLQSEFNFFHDQRALTGEFNIRNEASTAEKKQNQANVVDDMEFLGEAMAAAKTDEERDDLHGQMITRIEDSITSGLLEADGKGSGEELLETTLRKVDLLRIDNAIKADPAAAEAALEKGQEFHFLTLDDVSKAKKDIKAALEANRIEANRLETKKEKAEKKRILEIQDGMLSKYNTEDLSATDVMASDLPAFGQGSKNTFLGMIEKQGNGETDFNKTDGKLFNDLHERILLPEDDPLKIIDENDILPHIGQGLSRTDGDWLRGIITTLRKPSEAVQDEEDKELIRKEKEFFADVKGQITGTGAFGFADPKGGEGFYRFKTVVRNKVEQFKKEKKDPSVLFDPSSNEYMGNTETINSYRRSAMEVLKDQATSLSGDAPPVPQRKPDETIQEYIDRTKT